MFRHGDPGGRMYTSVGTSNANILAHWTNLVGGTWSVSSGNGRSGGSSIRVVLSGASTLSKTLDAQATWGIATGFRYSVAQTVQVLPVFAFLDVTTVQLDVRINLDGTLAITRNGTVLGTTSYALPLGSYVHLEFKGLIHPSAGTAELKVNGVSKLALSGINTRATANSSANVVQIGTSVAPGVSSNWDYDDIIIYDGQTTDANGNSDIHDFIGDCGLVWLLPTGAGTTTQFTPDTGSNYARVNETTPDGDSSYVEDATVGHIDTYALADLAGSATEVKSVASIQYAKKTDVGSRGIKAELRSNGGNTAHATEISLGNGYQYCFSNWGQDPNNGSPTDWTVAAVNSLQAGQNVSS